MATPAPPYRIQLALAASSAFLAYFRNAALGARHYAFSTNRMVFTDRWLEQESRGDLATLVERDGVQGIVAALHTPEEEARYAGLGIPVVNVSNTVQPPALSVVTQNDRMVGHLAAKHLLACGCRAFGFWGQQNASYTDLQLEGFREALTASGHGKALKVAFSHETKWSQDRMRTWLADLPKPVGIFTVLDTFGLGLIRAARELRLKVPEDVAVLGAGDDDFWVEFESVPLSSIRLPAKKIGYEAAALLDRLISSAQPKRETICVPVSEIAVRHSTDILHVEDDTVSRALLYIRTHATENPYVGEIARAVGVSLSSLQTRFQKQLGRPLIEEVRRVRLARAQELLVETDLSMSMVAERCGFPNSQRFSILFRTATGETPTGYRRKFRAFKLHG